MTLREVVNAAALNEKAKLPFELRLKDFKIAMQDVYDFFYDVNSHFQAKGLPRLDDTLRAANMSGTISDMLTASLAKHSRSLCQNSFHNGHPDLIVKGKYANDSVQAGADGVEIKTTLKKGGAVDTHGGREQWMCVFVYEVDKKTEPAQERRPTRFIEVYLSKGGSRISGKMREVNSAHEPQLCTKMGCSNSARTGFTYRSKLNFGIAAFAILKNLGSASSPILRYPTAFAAANVEPDPAKGSKTTPSPSGSEALTICLKKSWGFRDG